MKKDKKNEEIIDSYDYLTNAASTTDCTGLMPTPANTEEQRESYDAIFHLIGNSNHIKCDAGMCKATPLNPENEEE